MQRRTVLTEGQHPGAPAGGACSGLSAAPTTEAADEAKKLHPSPRRPLSLALLTLACASVNAVLLAHNELRRADLPVAARPARPLASALGLVARRAVAAGDDVDDGGGSASSVLRQLRAIAARLDGPRGDGGVRSGRGAGRRRTFRVQRSRADLRVAVSEALVELGLTPLNSSGANCRVGGGGDGCDFDVYWGSGWSDHAAHLDTRLKPHMLVSSFVGMSSEALADAESLRLTRQLCEAQYGDAACDFTPRAYSMPSQAGLWRAAVRTRQHWIRKGVGGRERGAWARGAAGAAAGAADAADAAAAAAGFSIVSSPESLPPAPEAHESYVLQEYVSHPLLWHGYKHSLRLWAVVASVAPLRLYLLQARNHRPRITASARAPTARMRVPTALTIARGTLAGRVG